MPWETKLKRQVYSDATCCGVYIGKCTVLNEEGREAGNSPPSAEVEGAGFACWDELSDLEPAPEVALCKNCLLMVAELNRLGAGGGWWVEEEGLAAVELFGVEGDSLAAADGVDGLG